MQYYGHDVDIYTYRVYLELPSDPDEEVRKIRLLRYELGEKEFVEILPDWVARHLGAEGESIKERLAKLQIEDCLDGERDDHGIYVIFDEATYRSFTIEFTPGDDAEAVYRYRSKDAPEAAPDVFAEEDGDPRVGTASSFSHALSCVERYWRFVQDEKQKKRRLPRSVRGLAERALEVVSLKTCGVAEEHKAAIQPYLDTWARGPLQQLLRWDDRELNTRDIESW